MDSAKVNSVHPRHAGASSSRSPVPVSPPRAGPHAGAGPGAITGERSLRAALRRYEAANRPALEVEWAMALAEQEQQGAAMGDTP